MTTQPPIVAQSDAPEQPSLTVPTEHTSVADKDDDEDDVARSSRVSTSDTPPPLRADASTTGIGNTTSSAAGVIEIGREAVSALEAPSNTAGKVFTV